MCIKHSVIARNEMTKQFLKEIATFPSVIRNDSMKTFIAFIRHLLHLYGIHCFYINNGAWLALLPFLGLLPPRDQGSRSLKCIPHKSHF